MQETQWPKAKEVLKLPEGQIIAREELGDEKFWENNKFREKYFQMKEAKGVNAAAEWYLDFKDKSPYGALAPAEAAAGYSSVILELVNKLDKGKEKSKTGVLPKTIISHDLIMEPFLFYAIGEQVMANQSSPGKTFMEKIGGAIDVVHGFQIEIEKGGKEITALLSFRGHKYSIDLENLQKLTVRYEK